MRDIFSNPAEQKFLDLYWRKKIYFLRKIRFDDEKKMFKRCYFHIGNPIISDLYIFLQLLPTKLDYR